MSTTQSLKGRIAVAVAILCLSVVIGRVRSLLAGVDNPGMAVWAPHVIFGLYFAILALAIQRMQGLFGPGIPEQRLFLFVLIGLCLDLVLVNYQEAVGENKDAAYGFIVLSKKAHSTKQTSHADSPGGWLIATQVMDGRSRDGA